MAIPKRTTARVMKIGRRVDMGIVEVWVESDGAVGEAGKVVVVGEAA